jgi:CRISPR-associated protein Csb1
MSVSPLTIEHVREAITGHTAAFRAVTELQPAAGAGGKIFPPTYEGGTYAFEKRYVPGELEPVDCVLLDSVQSQANRMELALLHAWREGLLPLPVVTVDFAGNELERVLNITSLEAPHRIADALLRDSHLNGTQFRKSEKGQLLDHVDNTNATALFELCPTALIFGMWDSTGPKGALGAKFARALVSEIVGFHAIQGVKTSSRIDPAQIMVQAGPLYKTKDGGWTLRSDEAVMEKGKPVKFRKEGRPSEANHGNVTPGIDPGGVTISKATQTTVLSLPALRRLRFPLNGMLPSHEKQAPIDTAARTALASLALCAATLTREDGDLRSRCQLFPTQPNRWDLLGEPGQPPKIFSLSRESAIALYKSAVDAARAIGLPWLDQELILKPSRSLVELVRKSQKLAAQEPIESENV